MTNRLSRRSFLTTSALGAAAVSLGGAFADEPQKPNIQGFDETDTDVDPNAEWKPFTDKKLKMGIVGFGLCQFGAQFGLQNHPNVEVVAVSDLFPERRDGLAKACKCEKTYESLEEMIKDDSIEAIFIATDAPSHCDHACKILKSGKHVASAVPAVFGSLEQADKLFETVKETGLQYGMFETSCFHDDVYAARKIYKAGGFGQMVYTEGEYYHYGVGTLEGYKNWRRGLPPQWYPTHSNAYYTCVTGNSYTRVSCIGHVSKLEEYQKGANPWDNPFGTETALFNTSEGGSARMIVSWDTAGWGGETGRMRGEVGAFNGAYQPLNDITAEIVKKLGELRKPALPPQVGAGGHGGSHGYLGSNFVESVLKGKAPIVNVAVALNTTVAGIVAHQSALKDGESMAIPQYKL
ncbi:MAG: Gfo/Idh/MocA family oxidoreductase [Thermoguttaceae bacterium]|nr:Gfo/Idh/MocA family oxidoreductase [Thermoguttaceae bacterium]MBQ2039667.1 Gfo/Idh/MocA family oxidoreductase [Thermoguttaceae bacterium]MBQ4079978.1 Gfo/Idh/MocA family oxidoreductase [Thermoguttaceae bacterium]